MSLVFNFYLKNESNQQQTLWASSCPLDPDYAGCTVTSKARDHPGLNLTRPVAEPFGTGVRMEGEAPQAAVGSGEGSGSGSGTDGAHPTFNLYKAEKDPSSMIDDNNVMLHRVLFDGLYSYSI